MSKRTIVFLTAILGIIVLIIIIHSVRQPALDDEAVENVPVETYTFTNHNGDHQYKVDLYDDNSAAIYDFTTGFESEEAVATGTWEEKEDAIVIHAETYQNDLLETGTSTLTILHYNGFPYEVELISPHFDLEFEITDFTLGAGDTHALVTDLQDLLENVPSLQYVAPEEAVYDEETRQAVFQFQQENGLVASGAVDYATWRVLHEYEVAVAPTPIPTVAPPPTTPPSSGSKVIYFTFDDGPHPTYSPLMLDVLKKYNAEATFFVLGQQVEPNADIVRAQATRGHYIANHTWDHQQLTDLSLDQVAQEIQSTRDVVNTVTGDLFSLDKDVLYVRPPYGAVNAEIDEYITSQGYIDVLWNLDTQDWRRPGTQQIADYIISEAYPGAIILMHDGGGDRSQSVQALDIAMGELQAQGYTFETIFTKYN